MRTAHLIGVVVALWLAAAALAQPVPPRVGSVATDSDLLDQAAVNRAAARLAEVGVEALALLVEAPIGDSQAEAEAYLDGVLERYSFLVDDRYLVVFVGLRPLPQSDDTRPLIVDYGAPLVAVLEQRSGGRRLVDQIYDELLVPRLQAGDPTGAFTATFDRVAEALRQSPTPSDSAPAPTTSRRRDGVTNLLAVLIALGLAVGGWWWYRRRRGPAAAGGPDTELERVKGALSQLLIDLSGQGEGGEIDAYLPQDPEQQTDFVLIRSFYGDGHSEEAEELAARYREASERLQQVEEGFKALRAEEEATRPSPEAAAQKLAGYQSLLAEAELVRAFTRELGDTWQRLQARTEAVPKRLVDLREAVTQAGARLDARGPMWPDAAEVFAQVSATIDEAAVEHQADRALEASRLLDRAEGDAEAIEAGLERLAEAQERLDELQVQLDVWRQAGFAMDRFGARRAELAAGLAPLAATLARPSDRVVAAVAEMADAVSELAAQAQAWPELQRRNAERLAALKGRGDHAAARIEEGARAFAVVDDFAASNWQDIRGNGSEAQKAADRAFELYQAAADDNALRTGDGDYQRAAAAIDEAGDQLDRVEGLVAAILERLQALEQARATARQQLEAVDSDLSSQQALLARPEVARDVGPGPERDLAEAAALVAKGKAALSSAQTDWLTLMADVQAADRLADQALASIRSEREAMDRLRARVASEAQEAGAALSKLENFARIHRQDLSSPSQGSLRQAREAYQRAEALAADAAGLEDASLAQALAAAAEAYDGAQSASERAFEQAERDFREMERLRADTSSSVASLEADLVSFERYLRRNDLWGSMARMLGDFQGSLPRYRSGADRQQLQVVQGEAARLQTELAAAMREAKRRREAAESALRRERQRRLEEARRRKASQQARNAATWGSQPKPQVRAPARPSPSSSVRPKVRPTTKARPSSRKTGSWGGKGRKSGGW